MFPHSNLVFILPTLDIFYSKVLSLVYLQPCHYMLSIHVYFALIMFPLTPCLSSTSHLSHLHFPQLMIRLLFLYDTLMFKYQLWFPVIDYSTRYWPPMKPLFQTSGNPLSLQRSSFILDLYAPLSGLHSSSGLLPNSQTTSNTSGILRVPRTHPKYLDMSMR